MQSKLILLAVVVVGLISACVGNLQKKGARQVHSRKKLSVAAPLEGSSPRFQEVGLGLKERSSASVAARKGGKKKGGKAQKAQKSSSKVKKSPSTSKGSSKCSSKGSKGGCKPKPKPLKSKTNPITQCVMCEYFLEMADRSIAAQPNGMAGAGYTPRVMNMNVQASLLEASSGKKGVPVIHKKVPEWYGRTRVSTRTVSPAGKSNGDYSFIESGSKWFNKIRRNFQCNVGKNMPFGLMREYTKACPIPYRVHGRSTERSVDSIDSTTAKDHDFEQTYKLLMDSFDDTCYSDMPQEYIPYCKAMYAKGNAMAEMRQHGFEPWEICKKLICPTQFFDA